MNKQSISNAKRKLYAKPEVTRVRLTPNEAVLVVCKDGASSILCGAGGCTVADKDAGS